MKLKSLLSIFLRLCSAYFLLLPSSFSLGFLLEPPVTKNILEEGSAGTDVSSYLTTTGKNMVKARHFHQMTKSGEVATNGADDRELHVVLFGVGDLRIDDHKGLYQALGLTGGKNDPNRKILPLVILDNGSLSKIPGIVSHTIDTANMLVAALNDLSSSLRELLGLELQVVQTSKTLMDAMVEIMQQSDGDHRVIIHVHDLGDVDNAMGYAPYLQLENEFNNLPSNAEISHWTCHLREKPWRNVESLPEKFPDYEKQYCVSKMPAKPVTVLEDELPSVEGVLVSTIDGSIDVGIPKAKILVERIQTTLQLNPEMVKAEVNTGIFQSHWGGLDASTVGESKVKKVLDIYVNDCVEEDALFVKNGQYVARKCSRNSRSLEHVTFAWMLKGTGKNSYPETNNILAGEPMTRFLAAPLMFGTLSQRRLWHMSTRQRPYFVSPLKTLAEGGEWHKLLAAKNMRTRPEYQPTFLRPSEIIAGETGYGYWRWHGFLCRYAQTPLTGSNGKFGKKEGVLLFHGFGASATQWNKALRELSTIVREDPDHPSDVVLEGLAPDLLGFGQSEKPPISYSIYVWDSMCTDFIKEVAVHKQDWDSYVVGGNSIGGFSAASTAANEYAEINDRSVCSSGAPGTKRCQGVVLMNPAGPIKSREEVQQMEDKVQGNRAKLLTVAQMTAVGAMPPCDPLARPVARTFGNGLLSYLRPRIQSICKNLYPTNPSAVDDALCRRIERDSLDPGAIAVMISGTKLPPPRSMNEMLKADYGKATEESTEASVPDTSFEGPVLVATGVLDPLNDAKGRSESLQALRDGIEFDPVSAGHCPHDEMPSAVAAKISKWMTTSVRQMNQPKVSSLSR